MISVYQIAPVDAEAGIKQSIQIDQSRVYGAPGNSAADQGFASDASTTAVSGGQNDWIIAVAIALVLSVVAYKFFHG